MNASQLTFDLGTAQALSLDTDTVCVAVTNVLLMLFLLFFLPLKISEI